MAKKTRRATESGMRIGLLGSGLMGAKRETIRARAGHEVVFSYARSPATLKELARDAGFDPLGAGPLQIARYTEPFAWLVAPLPARAKAGGSWPIVSSASVSRFL